MLVVTAPAHISRERKIYGYEQASDLGGSDALPNGECRVDQQSRYIAHDPRKIAALSSIAD